MSRTKLPDGITRADVLQAIDELKSGTAKHTFHSSEKFDLVFEGERYAPKAVLGLAARRVAGRTLEPADFSGGEDSTCFRILRSLGFVVELKPGLSGLPQIDLIVGKEYNRRKEIHGCFGGQVQGGIATPTGVPFVLLFTGEGGDSFGYEDKFRDDGVFLYTGEGQVGNMKFERGNLAIRDSHKDGKQLLLFEQTRKGYVRFFGYGQYLGHHTEQRPDSSGAVRDAIIFELEVRNEMALDQPATATPIVHGADLQLPKARTLAELRAAALLTPPAGLTPKQRQTVVYYRANAVKRYVLSRAKGFCEGCNEPAPFLNRKKQPYLEPHHTTRRADGGPDHPAHVIALCPTCHRRVHNGIDGPQYNDTLITILAGIEATCALPAG